CLIESICVENPAAGVYVYIVSSGDLKEQIQEIVDLRKRQFPAMFAKVSQVIAPLKYSGFEQRMPAANHVILVGPYSEGDAKQAKARMPDGVPRGYTNVCRLEQTGRLVRID